jgi:hypothetical protein
MVEDVLKALQVFNGREVAMGRVWLTMNNLKKHIFNLRNPLFNLPGCIAVTLEGNFMKRWDMMVMDLHYLGALLNPYLKDVLEIQENGDAKRILNRVEHKLCTILGVRFNDAMAELTEYKERRGPYSLVEAPDIREAHMEPHQWWHRVGGNALPKIAKRILSLTCSASSCERNWNMYSFVHSKSRNCLGVNKAEALVYIYTNSKLLRQKPGADLVRWYNNNIFCEDSDPDDNGEETESEGNDDDGDGGVGEYIANGAEFGGENEGGAERAPNNNAGGGNTKEFNWDALMAEDPVPNANCGNRFPIPDVEDGRSSHGSEDYDNVPSDDGGSYGNVRNGNDEEMARNVQNRN